MSKSLESLEQQRAKVIEQIVQLNDLRSGLLPPVVVVANRTVAAINPNNPAMVPISA